MDAHHPRCSPGSSGGTTPRWVRHGYPSLGGLTHRKHESRQGLRTRDVRTPGFGRRNASSPGSSSRDYQSARDIPGALPGWVGDRPVRHRGRTVGYHRVGSAWGIHVRWIRKRASARRVGDDKSGTTIVGDAKRSEHPLGCRLRDAGMQKSRKHPVPGSITHRSIHGRPADPSRTLPRRVGLGAPTASRARRVCGGTHRERGPGASKNFGSPRRGQ